MTGKDLLDEMEKAFNIRLRAARKVIAKDDFYEEQHLWLRKYAIGKGIEIASGDFPTEEGMLCVDSAYTLGNMMSGFVADAANLYNIDSSSLDYVLCNYLDAMPVTIAALDEWFRVLKPSGVVAIMVIDADADDYQKLKGPLSNNKRVVLFTKIVIKRYLERSGFTDIDVEAYDSRLRVYAKKPAL